MNVGDIFLEKEEGNSSLTLFLSKEDGSFSARLRDFAGNQTALDPSRIKCGIMGATSHRDFIQKVAKVARDKLAVFCYPTVRKAVEVWLFEAVPLAAPWIKRAKEFLKLDNLEEALKQLETAFKIQQQQQGDTIELATVILQLKKEHFLHHIKKASSIYLSPEYEASFHQIIETYGDQENFFSCLSEYLKAVDIFDPSHHYLAALLYEHQKEYIHAVPHYLELASKHENPFSCLKKAAELVKTASDPFAFPHFLEELDREWLVQLSETIQDPELKQWILLKDAIRMVFEECLIQLNQTSPQKQAPTCFICFNVEEADVGRWLEHTLVPDLDRMGIKPIFCFRDLGPGKELNNFQGLIRSADQVIIVCTPELKKKCDERKKAPTGVAQEIRLVKERYNDPDKYETIFPLYLKGDRKSSCPSEFFEPILGTTFTYLDKSTESSVFSYYATVFELFGAMRGIPSKASRQTKERFINKVGQIIRGNYDLEKVEKWRSDKASKNTEILKAAQERVSRMTQMVNLPEAPVDFTGRKEELEKLHVACKHKSRVAGIYPDNLNENLIFIL